MALRLTLSLGLLAGASAIAAPVPKDAGRPPCYFPTTVGAKWVYERNNLRDETVEVSAVEKSGDELIVSRKGQEGGLYADVIVSAEGVRQDRLNLHGKTHSMWLVKTKLRAGDSWDVTDGKRTVYGPEPIEVPAGKYQALRVLWEHEGGVLTSWYVPGIGEVKRVEKKAGQETVTRLLKSFTPGEKK